MKQINQLRVFSALIFLAAALSSHANDLVWQFSGSAGTCNGGGAGTWDTTSLFWHTNDCAGTYFPWVNSTTNTADFPGSAAYAVTLGSNMTVNKLTNDVVVASTTTLGLTFSVGGGTQITMGGTSPTIHTPNKLTMNPPLKGAVTLTKTGAGQLQLNNNGQTLSKYVIKGGIISSANTNKWGPGVGGAQDAVTLDGGGIGNDTTSQTYNNWGITLGSGNGSIGLFSATLTVTLNTKITGSGGLNFGGSAASTAGYSAAGIYILGNTNNKYTGTTTLSKGTLKLGASEVLPDGSAVQVNSGTTLDFNTHNETIRSLQGNSASAGGTVSLGTNSITLVRTSGTTSFPGTITGTGNLTKNGAYTQHLIGANSYSGKTAINAGILGITADASLGTPPGSPVADQLKFGGGTLLSSNAFELNINRGITLAGNATWNVADSSEVTYNGEIVGLGGFTKSGLDTSTLVLGGSNSFVGSVTVSGGTLKLTHSNAIPSTVTTIAVNGSTNKLDLNNFDLVAKDLNGSGTIMSSGGLPGSITITNGRVAAGNSLTGNNVGLLTMQSSLNLTDGTNRWELSAQHDDADGGVAGVDYDQVLFTAGTFGLYGSNYLSINFINSTNVPDFATPFWQASHKWTVIKVPTADANLTKSNFVSVITNVYYYAGTFSTAVEESGDITLSFTPAGPTGPIMLADPQNKTVGVGTNATLSVSATGTAPLNYQWYFGSNPVTDATNSSLTITSAQPANEGSYHVTIVNDFGSITSSNATLSVVFPPTIDTPPADQTVNVGSPVTFFVNVSGTAPFTYQWKKNGTNIISATSSSYTIGSVVTNDAGSYSVGVTNVAGGVISSNAVLTVNTAPAISPTLSLSVTPTTATLTWPSENGRTYQPQFNFDLNLTNWTDLAPTVAGNGATVGITNNISGTTNRYYRVKVLP